MPGNWRVQLEPPEWQPTEFAAEVLVCHMLVSLRLHCTVSLNDLLNSVCAQRVCNYLRLL